MAQIGPMLAWGVAIATFLFCLVSIVGGSWSGKDHDGYHNPFDDGKEDENGPNS